MSRPCTSCGNLIRSPIGLYVCEAQRLPDPEGNYTHLPTRTAARPGCFRFGQPEEARQRTQIERAMSPGPVEGWVNDLQGQRRPFEYQRADCPAWRVR